MPNFWDDNIDARIKEEMDRSYSFNKSCPNREDFRNWVNNIYKNFIDYCPDDTNKFLEESRKKWKFNSKLWEMYTFHILFKTSYIFEKTNKEGPDLLIKHENRKIWIECVAPQNGNNANKIEDSPIGTPYITQSYEDYLLRIAQSFIEKFNKISNYKTKGIISENDFVIIAINTGSLNSDIQTKEFTNGFPFIVNACFGIGGLTYSFPIGEEEQNNPPFRSYEKKEKIFKKNMSYIDINYFNSNIYNIISGVLYTNKSVFDSFYNNVSEQVSFKRSISHISLVHNHFAINKLSKEIFKDFKHYFVEDEILKTCLNEEIKDLMKFKIP
ncbi:MAG: hypothetical protein K2X69_01825 [Silvanigrellaceae bacterium]|nr:hypothetical protein [Silvanigrellaceae bacterium]